MSSASAQGGSPGTSIIIFFAVFVLLVIRRIYRSYAGTRFSAGRTIGYAVFYVVLGSFFSILSFFEGVSLIFALPYALLLLGAAFFSYRFTDRRISFWSGGDGSVYFKGGVLLYVIYVVGLVARLSIEVIFFGSNFFAVAPGSTSLTPVEVEATIATDLLMMFGLGLLIGRNARVLARYRRIEAGKEELPSSPPAYQPLFRRRGKAEDGSGGTGPPPTPG